MSLDIDFEVGDIVMLRSGGPKMTIAHIAGGMCMCAWFDKSRPRTDQFDPAMLFRPRKPNAKFLRATAQAVNNR